MDYAHESVEYYDVERRKQLRENIIDFLDKNEELIFENNRLKEENISLRSKLYQITNMASSNCNKE